MGCYFDRIAYQSILNDLRLTIREKYSWFTGSLLLINTTLGAGLLNFPTAFYESGGILNTILLQLLILILITLSMHILVYLTHKYVLKILSISHDNNIKLPDSYEEIIGYYCGFKIKLFISLIILLYSFGTCITYLIIICDQLQTINLNFLDKNLSWYAKKDIQFLIISCGAILPLCFSKTINFLSGPSALGTLSMIYIPFMIVINYFGHPHHSPTTALLKPDYLLLQPEKKYSIFSSIFHHHNQISMLSKLTNMFEVIPAICFLYNSHLSLVPTYHSLGKSSSKTFAIFSKAILVNIFFCVVIYNLTGIFGYLMFGDRVMLNTDILTAFDNVDTKIFIAIALLIGKMIATYPIVIFCARITIVNTFITILLGEYHPYDELVTTSVTPSLHRKRRRSTKSLRSFYRALDNDYGTESSVSTSVEEEHLYEPRISPDRSRVRRYCTGLYRFSRDYLLRHSVGTERWFRITVTLILFFASLVLTIYVPNIGKMIPLLGSLSLLLLFVFPAAALLVDILDEKEKVELEEFNTLRTGVDVLNPDPAGSTIINNPNPDSTNNNEQPATSYKSTSKTNYGNTNQEIENGVSDDGNLPDFRFSHNILGTGLLDDSSHPFSSVLHSPRLRKPIIAFCIFLITTGVFFFGTVFTRATLDLIKGN